MDNAYTDSTSTTYATINPTRGKNAETWVYFVFDTSSIPSGATIVSVSCKAKGKAANASNITQRFQMYSGTTAMGSASNLTTSATERTLSVGSNWTLSDVWGARLKLYAVRGTGNTSTTYAISVYGATLTVTYTYEQAGQDIFYKQNGDWVSVDSVYVKQNGVWVQTDTLFIKDNGTWKS